MTAFDQKACYKSWQSFVRTGIAPRMGVRPPILRSWIRCNQSSLDPRAAAVIPRGLDAKDVERLRARNRELLTVASPFIRDLAHFVRGSGFLVILTDAQGLILEIAGDSENLEYARDLGLYVGRDWSEQGSGTNAMGVAIVEKAPVQVVGCEHYRQDFHQLTCSAAPIFHQEGQLLGVLDVSGPTDRAHSHTLGMAVAAARAIERQLKLMRSTHQVQTTNRVLDVVLNSMREGMLVVDRRGCVIKLNARARELLSPLAREEDWNLFDALGDETQLVPHLASGTPFDDEEVMLSFGGQSRRFLISAKPVMLEGALTESMVLSIQPVEQVNRLVHRVRGHHARFTVEDIIGRSPQIQQTKREAMRAAARDVTVLLLGESGTGKELVAHGIHNASSRKTGPFIALNCSAIPRTLLESELFGYEPGAFTGAARKGQPGKFELADGGTLFLDEIGDMPFEMQSALLRVLQEREVLRLGGGRPSPVNVRVIAATNRDLCAEVKAGNFRADLLYRLDVVTIGLPPLRERATDIPLLVEYFLTKKNVPLARFTPEALQRLMAYSWPGNVRELENVTEKCLHRADGDLISCADLPPMFTAPGPALNPPQAGKAAVPAPAKSGDHPLMAEDERLVLLEALRLCAGNLSQVARHLGISRPTLYRKLHRYGLQIAK